MIEAVLDTQTLVSGLGWQRAPARTVVNAALAGRFVPVTTPALLAELEQVLRSRHLVRAFTEPDRVIRLVTEMSVVVEPAESGSDSGASVRDRLLAAARASAADFLVTGDIGLLEIGAHGRTRIVRPQ